MATRLSKPPAAPAGFDPHRFQSECDYWYQRWQVFDGVHTPGFNAVEPMCARMRLPTDLAGLRVLDIGAWNGCVTMECERRGAAEIVALGPEDPGACGFDLLRQITGSTRASYRLGSCYQLDPDEIGYFDVVLLCGVLYHLRYPLLGLDNVRRVCRGTLYVESHVCDVDLSQIDERLLTMPLWRFYRGDELFHDPSNWFGPTSKAVVEALESAGFAVDHTATSQPTRAVFRATAKAGVPEFLSLPSIEGRFYETISRPLLGPWQTWLGDGSAAAEKPVAPPAKTAERGLGGPLASAAADRQATRCLIVSAGLCERQAGDVDLTQAKLYREVLPLLRGLAPVWDVAARRQSLDEAVTRARAEGLRPVHLTFAPLFAMRLAGSAPNVAFAAWPYPDLPTGTRPGQPAADWTRLLPQLSLLIAGSRFTERGFRAAGVEVPIESLLPPVADPFFDLPPWSPGLSANWHGPAYLLETSRDGDAAGPWVFPVRQRTELSGIVYTAVVDPDETAANWLLLMDTYLEALAERADATLVLKFDADNGRDQPHLAKALQYYRTLARKHHCRLLLLPGELTRDNHLKLVAASAFQVTASRAEGACTAIAAALAAGRPVIAPRHTALADYLDADVGLVVKSRPEPARISLAPRPSLDTVWHEVNRRSMIEAFRASHALASKGDGYRQLGDNARRRMGELCSNATFTRRLFAALDAL